LRGFLASAVFFCAAILIRLLFTELKKYSVAISQHKVAGKSRACHAVGSALSA
jgi:hypothetical protein